MKRTILACTASLFALTATPAFAQAAPTAEEAPADGDIIVTATRSETRLSKTPIAMTAIAGEELIKSGISNPTQLEASVPNVSIIRGNGLQITIRGVTSSNGNETGDPSAAFMLNGVYIARQQAQEVSFFDVERVEVLRGPQGTLYGRNTTAGVVNIISARPKFELGGSVDLSYGSFNQLLGSAVVNIPAGDKVAFRAAVNYDRRNSYLIDGNSADGVTFNPFKDNKSVRLSALLKPADNVSLLVIGEYSKMDGNPTDDVPIRNYFSSFGTGPRQTFDVPVEANLSNRAARTKTQAQAQQALRDNKERGVMAELNVGLGAVTFTYLGSYRALDRREFYSLADGALASDFNGKYWQTSHEARLALDSGPLKAQVGGYFFHENSAVNFFLINAVQFGLPLNSRFGFPQNPTIADNKSVFGQATYEIAPRLRLTGGLRYSSDFKSRKGQTELDFYNSVSNSYNTGTLVGQAVFGVNDAARTFSKLTWRAGIDYDSDLGLIFASVSTGFKAGGMNDGCEVGKGPSCNLQASDLYYAPETLTAYEAGFKFALSPKVRLNGSVFHYDYKNLQLSSVENVCGGTPCQVTRNAGVAKVDGVELDARFLPIDGLTITASLNWLNARYVAFSPTYDSSPAPGFQAASINFAGRPLSRSPKWSGGLGVNYAIPMGEAKVVLDGQFSFRSRYDLTDLGNYAYFYQRGYTKSDFSVTYRGANDAFYVGAFVKNIENTLALTLASAGGNLAQAVISDPRTFGVRAGVKF